MVIHLRKAIVRQDGIYVTSRRRDTKLQQIIGGSRKCTANCRNNLLVSGGLPQSAGINCYFPEISCTLQEQKVTFRRSVATL